MPSRSYITSSSSASAYPHVSPLSRQKTRSSIHNHKWMELYGTRSRQPPKTARASSGASCEIARRIRSGSAGVGGTAVLVDPPRSDVPRRSVALLRRRLPSGDALAAGPRFRSGLHSL